MRSSRFEASDDRSTVARAAQDLSEGAGVSGTGDGDVCRIYTPVGTAEAELRVTWRRSGSVPESDPDPKFTVLPMGERALTATDGAFLRFVCRSAKLTGAGPAHVDIGVERGGMPTTPEGDPGELKDAYATVAHSFSRALPMQLAGVDAAGPPFTPRRPPRLSGGGGRPRPTGAALTACMLPLEAVTGIEPV
ncbi:hypothetical protein ACFWGE_14315 [Streptomyces bacillaris]|uniref:hypothetical protein n=1 Tax=Streptomyces bacillaris TaxID=68179 RepID=UPI003653737C